MTATPASGRVSPRLPPDTPPRIASHCAAMYAKGAVAALSLHRVARYASKSKRLRTLAARCVLVNGVVFLGSLALFDHALAPFIGWVLARWTAADAAGGAGGAGEIPRRERVFVVPVDRARRVAVSDLLREHGGQLVHAGEIARISCALAAEDDEDDERRAAARACSTRGREGREERRTGCLELGAAWRVSPAVYHVLIVNSLFAQITALSSCSPSRSVGGSPARRRRGCTRTTVTTCGALEGNRRGGACDTEGNWCYCRFRQPDRAEPDRAEPVHVLRRRGAGDGVPGVRDRRHRERGRSRRGFLGRHARRTRQGSLPVFHLASASARGCSGWRAWAAAGATGVRSGRRESRRTCS